MPGYFTYPSVVEVRAKIAEHNRREAADERKKRDSWDRMRSSFAAARA